LDYLDASGSAVLQKIWRVLRRDAGDDIVHWPRHIAQAGIDAELPDVATLEIDRIHGPFEACVERRLKVDLIEPRPMRVR
jgi:hypothetical protein